MLAPALPPSKLMAIYLSDSGRHHSGNPGLVKRYPTMPAVSRISFDFLHYIRPPAQATPAPEESFAQLMHFLTNWKGRHTVHSSDRIADSRLQDDDIKDDDASTGDRLTVNLLRNLCHVFFFNCNQVLYRRNALHLFIHPHPVGNVPHN